MDPKQKTPSSPPLKIASWSRCISIPCGIIPTRDKVHVCTYFNHLISSEAHQRLSAKPIDPPSHPSPHQVRVQSEVLLYQR